MRNGDPDGTVVYTLLDIAEETPMHSTPAIRRSTAMAGQTANPSLLEEIGFDGPTPAIGISTERKTVRVDVDAESQSRRPSNFGSDINSPVRTTETETERKPVRSDGIAEAYSRRFNDPRFDYGQRKTHMKPGKFDGTGSLESFLTQFEVCAKYNRWSSEDKTDFLRCALDKAATQLLWDFGAEENVTYEKLVDRLRQRYGTEGQAETFRTQLYYRRQRPDESLSDLLHDIRRLVVLAYPVPSNATTEILARDAFLEAIYDRELSLKVREREPRSIDEAYRMALRLGAYQRMNDVDERRRAPNRVRGMHGGETSGQLQAQLDSFLLAQRKWQQELEEKMMRQLQDMRGPSRSDGPGRITDRRSDARQEITCYSCGLVGHIARRCPQPHRPNRRQQPQQAPRNDDSEPDNSAVTNHTTQEHPRASSNNAIYVRATVNYRSGNCLIDTGSEVSILPLSYVSNLELKASSRTLRAANGTEIRVLGELMTPLKFWRGFAVTSKFLVSDQVCEIMLGMDWLREHRCRIGFGTGALFVGRKRIQLVKGNGSTWCRRVVVAEEVEIAPRSQCDVPAKTLYGYLGATSTGWMTEATELMPGVRVARVLFGDRTNEAPIRIVNLGERVVRLVKDQSIGGLHPVQVTEPARDDQKEEERSGSSLTDGLMNDIPEEVPEQAKTALRELLTKFEDVFSATEGDLGRTNITEHKIDTGTARPIRQPLRRQPLPYRDAIDKHLDQMLDSGVIEPAMSEWAANVVLAKKKDGTLRFCIDYRQLNAQTRKDSYPLPRTDECLDALSGAEWFSTLDLRSGYHQVAMDPKDSDKTAFVTRKGIFRWRVMPFGLCNAPATFQRLMDIVLSGLNFEICLVYLDDVIVFGQSWEEHLERLSSVFQRLRSARLKLKPSKCHLLRRTVEFLGHIVSKAGIAVDPSKVQEVAAWPTPSKLRDVRAFLGLCAYYRKFIAGFSRVAAPLFALTKKDRSFTWDDDCQIAFDRLKTALTTAPVLSLPVEGETYVLDCDASDLGIGAVLSQRIEGEEKVIAYGSRLFSAAEKRYCITRKELLAVVHFVKVFRQYLLGGHFILRTDHAALRWLWKTPEPIGQQARWLERLAEYDFEIIHRPGLQHGNADALSRKPCHQCGETSFTIGAVQAQEPAEEPSIEVDAGMEDIAKAQADDPDLGVVRGWLVDGAEVPSLVEILYESEAIKIYWRQRDVLYMREGVVHRRTPGGVEQLLVPKALRQDFLRRSHTGMTGGHLGARRTKLQVRRRAYWVGWSGDVKRFCQQCSDCRQYWRGQPPRQGPLQPVPCGEPFERISIDLTGPHPRSRKGHLYILTVMDNFSKYVEAIPLANQEATTVAKALVENVILRYGAPLEILSDQGRNFDGNVFREVCKLLDIDKVRTSSYRPQTNGLIERFHRTMNAMLAKVISTHQHDWNDFLPYVTSAYRNSCNEVTGFSPNYLIFGKEARTSLDLAYGRPSETSVGGMTYSAYVTALRDRMDEAYTLVRQHLKRAAERRKRGYDLRVKPALFEKGDWVLYYSPRRYKGRSPKWMKCFTGPFMVQRSCGPVNYVLQRSAKAKPFVAHVDKLRLHYGKTKGEWGEPAPASVENVEIEVAPAVDRPRREIRRPARFV